MSLQAGHLLIVRKRILLEDGLNTVDTGITQQFLGVDPPVGGSDPTADADAIASRIEVKPLAPIPPWITANIHHSEPRFNQTTHTVEVDFWVAAGTGPVTINVLFWDPHTVVTPMDVDAYNAFTCTPPTSPAGFGGGGDGNDSPMAMSNPASGAGQLLLACAVVAMDDDFADPASAPTLDDAGWTELGRGEIDMGGGAGLKMVVAYRISVDIEPIGYTVSWTATTSSGNFLLEAFENVDTTDPLQSAGSVLEQPVSDDPLSLAAPSQTAVNTSGTLVCFWIANRGSSPGFVIPVSMQDTQGTVYNAAPNPLLQLSFGYDEIPALGPTGTRVGTIAADGAGMAFSVLLNGVCGIYPPEPPTMDVMGV